MHKKNLRILSVVLAILLMASIAVPAPVVAAPHTETEVEKQITTTYKRSLAYFGRKSFDGFCGAYTSTQLYVLGITTNWVGGNGNQLYNAFAKQKVTTGGYRVKAYPASAYTLKKALNAITKNGSLDAYNILVGFEQTNSTLGKKYGHATVIHAILDGTVYFSESYDVVYRGVRYPEGKPIGWSIDDFCSYYAATTKKLDGVIYFGLKSYAEGCRIYPASFYGRVDTAGVMMTQPCEEGVDADAKPVRDTQLGEMLVVTGLYLNGEGEYWYQVTGDCVAYVRANQVSKQQLITEDVQLVNAKTPSSLRQGRGYQMQGMAVAQVNSIYSIRAQVYQISEDELIPAISATDLVDGKNYNLKNSKLANNLAFRKLEKGQYRLEITAVVSSYYVENGQMQVDWETVSLWMSDFAVTASTTSTDTVTFDACGGISSLNRTIVPVGQAVGMLPIAQRMDYVFMGWYTDEVGGERVTADYIPDDSVTLYARWISVETLQNALQGGGECWYFHSDGLSVIGCIAVEGVLYYFSSTDPLGQGEMLWTVAGMS